MALALATFALSWQPSVAAQPVVQRCNRSPVMMVNPMQQAKLATLREEGEAVIARREEIANADLSILDFKAPGVSAETVATLKSVADKPTDYGYSWVAPALAATRSGRRSLSSSAPCGAHRLHRLPADALRSAALHAAEPEETMALLKRSRR